jgi:hypothetical protein
MNKEQLWAQFNAGQAVIERDFTDDKNPGHVIGFQKVGDEVFVRVQFANGDRYNVAPEELLILKPFG